MTITIPKSQTPGSRRASLLFAGCTRNTNGCRIEYAGPLPAKGPPRVTRDGRRFEDRQRLAYRHWNKVRLKGTDQVVAVCGSVRCLDKAHLFVVPAPVPPKPPKPPRASRARASSVPVIADDTTP